MNSKQFLQLILLSQGNFFLMIGSLEVTHDLIFAIPSVTQISSINSIRLIFNLGKPRLCACISGRSKEVPRAPHRHPTPTGQNFLNFIQFLGKSGKCVCMLAPPGGLTPLSTRNPGTAPVYCNSLTWKQDCIPVGCVPPDH